MGSERVGYRNSAVLLTIVLGLEFFRLIDVGVCNFETVDDESYSSDERDNKVFFVYTVTVPEGVAVKKDILRHGSSVNSEEDMDARASKEAAESRIGAVKRCIAVRAGPYDIGSKIIWKIPAEAYFPSRIGTGEGISNADPYMGNDVIT